MTAPDSPAPPAERTGGPVVVARPALWQQIDMSARVTVVSAPAGSGKTVLLTSWIGQASPADRTAFVQVRRDEHDPRRFWLSVLAALRETSPGSRLVRELTASPDLDGWAIVERLLADLAPLQDRLWLIVDDVHQLRSDDARSQLELLVLRAPPELRIVLATRHDVRLGLHRLRLESGLTEIRADILRFSLQEARELFQSAGVQLSAKALVTLHERAEGWAAGLRMAALSLDGHPDPERFAAEFSGTERTVAEYLLAEVLARQPDEVRLLLLCTSGLDRVSGELADLLTGGTGGERMLQDLEAANAFVVSLDATRSWFRYHHLFAELLQLELRRTEPDLVSGLHIRAAGWLAGHGYPLEAVRHAQAAGDWDLASRLLVDHWPGLHLDGQEATVHALMAAFPAGRSAADAELAAVAAAGELAQGSLADAEHFLGLAESGLARVPEGRRDQALALLGVVQMMYFGRSGDQPRRAQYAQRVAAGAGAVAGAARLGLSEELRAFALAEIGDSETWAGRFDLAESHLDMAIALGRRIGRPYVELMALVYRAEIELNRCFPRAEELSRQAMGLAERHGWTDDLFAGFAGMTLGSALAWQGQTDDADAWVGRAERIFRMDANPAAAMGGQYVRGQLEMGRGRPGDALAAFRAAERLAGPHPLARPLRAWLVHALAQLGQTDDGEDILAGLADRDRNRAEMRVATAALRLAQHNPRGATQVLAPVLERTATEGRPFWLIEAFLLEAIARHGLGELSLARRSLERALDLAEPDGTLLWFLIHPARELLETLAGQTAHPVLVAWVLDHLARAEPGSRADGPPPPVQPLTPREIRVLRYLPTHLSAPEIAVELHVSTSTVKTHLRNLYVKLDAHSRTEAVASARHLDLLAPLASAGQAKPSTEARRLRS